MKYWKPKHDRHLQEKFKMRLATYCFVCDELIDCFRDLEYHIKDGRHTKHVRDFKRTLPQLQTPKQPAPVGPQRNNDDQDGY
jgi:hypothetical protein